MGPKKQVIVQGGYKTNSCPRGLRNSCPGGSQTKQNCCPGGDFNCCPGGLLGGVKSRGLNCRYYSSTGCTSVLMQCGKVVGVVHVLLSRGE